MESTSLWAKMQLRIKQDKRAVSNVIVVMLSLVLVVIIVANVVLWSYQMNQLDLEREQESVNILLATRSSPWYTAQQEFTIVQGAPQGGYFVYTQIDDGAAEQFIEEKSPNIYRLEINNIFTINLSSFNLTYVKSIQILLKYQVDSTEDYWHLNAWNWTLADWSDLGSSQPISRGTWVYFNVTANDVADLVNATDGRVRVKVVDDVNVTDTNKQQQTSLYIDFLAVRALLKGSCFKFKNCGSLTVHLVALWAIDSSDYHSRYDVSLFVNPGETITYWSNVTWPSGPYVVKAVTERGNVGVLGGYSD